MLTLCPVDDQTGTPTTIAIHTQHNTLRIPPGQKAQLVRSSRSDDHGHRHPSQRAKLYPLQEKPCRSNRLAEVKRTRHRRRVSSIRNPSFKTYRNSLKPRSVNRSSCPIPRKMHLLTRAYQHHPRARMKRPEAGRSGRTNWLSM